MSWSALLIGTAIGVFLTLGSAFILDKGLKFMSDDSKTIGYAVGLGSLWVSKILAACVAIYYAQKMGVASLYLGIGIPLGILVGVFACRGMIKRP